MKNLHVATMFYKMGGGGGGGVATAAPTPAPPPASVTGAEATQAKMDASQQMKRRKGINSTLLQGAGQTDQQQAQLSGQPKGNVLLGGG